MSETTVKDILLFLSDLSQHNDREWFAANKARYDACRKRFEQLTQEYIDGLTRIDPELNGLQPKQCIWRIYRDVRFSADKRPYKEWFGTFPAAPAPGKPNTAGKHSMRGGYYLHLQPGHCLFAGGIWCPNPELLRALRQEIVANYDEVEAIMQQPSWQRFFGDFDTEWMLKKVPAGFEESVQEISTVNYQLSTNVSAWLKRKAYTFSTPLTDKQVCDPHFMSHLLEIAQAAKPMNDFLNYTFQEYGEFESRFGYDK
ncbi:MAG: DUF2461 domain-containing protein [Paludibacteraceae bacterium]|nr:DUF2461 domain-containing protein [Paludibacteraceae bacterium]